MVDLHLVRLVDIHLVIGHTQKISWDAYLFCVKNIWLPKQILKQISKQISKQILKQLLKQILKQILNQGI